MSVDVSPSGRAGGGPPISSPFASASWQDRQHDGSFQPHAQPQQQHVHWHAPDVSGGSTGHSLPAGHPDAAGSAHAGDLRSLSKPAHPPPAVKVTSASTKPDHGAALRVRSPAKPPSGRPGKSSAMLSAASAASYISSRDSLDGAFGHANGSMYGHDGGAPAASIGVSSLRRPSDSSIVSDASGHASGYTSRGHLGRAVYIAEDLAPALPSNHDTHHNGSSTYHSRHSDDVSRHVAASSHARRTVRLPISAPHSPRRHSSRDGGSSLQGAPWQRQHSWDGGTAPLLSVAPGYAPGTAAALQGGASAAAAAQQPPEPRFFDPSAHAMRLRAERSGGFAAEEPTQEWRGELPAWQRAAQRATSAAADAAPCVLDLVALPYPAVAAAMAEAEAAEAAEAAHLARERRWRQQRRQLELSHALKRDKAKAKVAQQAAAAAAAQAAAQHRGRAVAAALFALGAAAGLRLAAQQPQQGLEQPGVELASGAAELQPGADDAAKLETAMQRLSGAQPPSPAGSPLRRVSFKAELGAPHGGSSPPAPPRTGSLSRSPRVSGSLDFAVAKAASRVALGAVRTGFERSGAAKLLLEGTAKQLPQGGPQPAGRPAAVAALALERITHLRQAVFKAHYQYLLFLRNTFDRAAASTGTGAAARRLADAMCLESRTLRRVLDFEVRETRVVCKGWSDRLSWLAASGGAAEDEALQRVLISVHGRLEGINTPFMQAVAALEDVFRALAPQGGLLSHSSSAEQLTPRSPMRSPLQAAFISPTGSPKTQSPGKQPALRQRSSSGSLNALLQLQHSPPRQQPLLLRGSASTTAASSAAGQQLLGAGSGSMGVAYQPAAALLRQQSAPSSPAAAAAAAAAARGAEAAASSVGCSPERASHGGPSAARPGVATQAHKLLGSPQAAADTAAVARADSASGADVEADLQWQLLASLRQLDEARQNLAGRETELKAVRARVALQNSYIEKLEDAQSGFAGGSESSPAVRNGPSGAVSAAGPAPQPVAAVSGRTALGSGRLTAADWDARLSWE